MPIAIFGITNDTLNLVASLVLLMLVALYVALVVYTYLDARRRIEDPVVVACATVGALIPFIGTMVYAILRPPEFLEDARERDLEIKAAELRVRQLAELSCPNCDFPVEKNYLRCPNCQRRLKDPCQSCGKPVDPRWALCPYCETALPGRARQGQQEQKRSQRPPADERRPTRPQRSGTRPAGQPARQGSDRQAQPAQARSQQRPRPQGSRGEVQPRPAPDAAPRGRQPDGRPQAPADGRGRSEAPESAERQ
jgi:hypothetical protein